MVSFSRVTNSAVATWSDGTQATFPIAPEYFGSTSRVQSHHLLLGSNLLVAITTEGDQVTFELPPLGQTATPCGRPTIYLDQNHWSTLFKAEHAPERVSKGEATAARALRTLAQERKIVLPASAGTYSETTRFTDDTSRYRLGTTILQLSGGWRLRDPLCVRRTELRTAMRKFGGGQRSPAEHPVITLDANALYGAHRHQQATTFPDKFPEHIKHLLTETAAALAMIEVVLDAEHIPAGQSTDWVRWTQAFSDWLDTQAVPASRKRASIDVFLLHDLRFEIAQEAVAAGLTQPQLDEWTRTRFAVDVASMPALGLFREVAQERHLNRGTTWRENDLADMVYLSCAAGYCDYVVCERATAGLLASAIQKRGAGAKVHRRLSDAVSAIEDQLP